MGGEVDGALDISPSCESRSIGVDGSLGADIAERLRSRSSGGRFRGCVSALKILREFVLEVFFLGECRSESFASFVGDFETDRLDGECEEPAFWLSLLLESLPECFLVLKIPGRTIRSGLKVPAGY